MVWIDYKQNNGKNKKKLKLRLTLTTKLNTYQIQRIYIYRAKTHSKHRLMDFNLQNTISNKECYKRLQGKPKKLDEKYNPKIKKKEQFLPARRLSLNTTINKIVKIHGTRHPISKGKEISGHCRCFRLKNLSFNTHTHAVVHYEKR